MKNLKIEEQLIMLKGNLNRICVSDDPEDIDNMYSWAVMRLNIICAERKQELKQGEYYIKKV